MEGMRVDIVAEAVGNIRVNMNMSLYALDVVLILVLKLADGK
jgi:hypothetical protein